MTPSIEERLRIEKAKLEKQRAKVQALTSKQSAQERKKQNKEKYDLGGLVKIAFPGEVDKELVLGSLLSSAALLTQQDKAGIVAKLKREGAAELAKRAADRAAKRVSKEDGEN